MAPYDRNSGSNKTGQAALPHKNIQKFRDSKSAKNTGSFPPHLLWRVFIIFSCSAVVCFFFLPYFVGFQLFGLTVAQEAQNQL